MADNDKVQVIISASADDFNQGLQDAISQLSSSISQMTTMFSQMSGNISSAMTKAAEVTTQSSNAIQNASASTANSTQSTFSSISNAISSMSGNVKGAFSTLGEAMGSVMGVASKISGVMAGAALFGSAVSATKNYYTEINKLSSQLGITTQQASGLNVALKGAGISTEDYLGASRAMTRQLSSGATGFTKLGVSVKNADGSFKNSQQLLLEVAGVLRNTAAGTSRNVAAMEIFKRAQIDVNKFSKLSAEGMAEAAQKAEQLGLMVGPQQMANFNAYTAAQRQLGIVTEALSVNIGNVMLPILANFGAAILSIPSKISGVVSSIQNWLSSHQEVVTVIEAVAEAVGTLVAVWGIYKVGVLASAAATVVMNGITTLSTTLMKAGSISTAIATAATNLFSGSCFKAAAAQLAMITPMGILIGSIVVIGVAIATLATAWYTNFNGIKDATAGTIDAIAQAFSKLWEHIKNMGSSIIQILKGALALDPATIDAGVNSFKSNWSGAMSDLGSIGSNMWKGLKTAGILAFEGVRDKAKGIMSSLGFGGDDTKGGEQPQGNPFTPSESGQDKNGKENEGQTEYEKKKKEYETAVAQAKYDAESQGKSFTYNDQLYLYQSYLKDVQKLDDEHHHETLEFKMEELNLERQNIEEQVKLKATQYKREQALAAAGKDNVKKAEEAVNEKVEKGIALNEYELKLYNKMQESANALADSQAKLNAETEKCNLIHEKIQASLKAEADLLKTAAKNQVEYKHTDIENAYTNRQITEPKKRAYYEQENQSDYDKSNANTESELKGNLKAGVNYSDQLAEYQKFLTAVDEKTRQESLDKMEKNAGDPDKLRATLNQGLQAYSTYFKNVQNYRQQDQQYNNRYVTLAFNTMETSMAKGLNGILQRTTSFSQAMKNIFNSMVKSLSQQWTSELAKKWTDSLSQMYKQLTTHKAKVKTAETTGDAAVLANKTATDAAEVAKEQAKAAQLIAINKEKNAKIKEGNATESQAAVTDIGTEIAQMLEMMAVVYLISSLLGSGSSSSSSTTTRASGTYYQSNSVSGLPSYDVGSWSLPSDSIAKVHKGEMIVPAKGGFADTVRGMMAGGSNGTGSGSGAQVNHSPTYNVQAMDAKGVGRVLKDNSRQVTQSLYRVQRSMAKQNATRWGLT